jgi:hypothetical protein
MQENITITNIVSLFEKYKDNTYILQRLQMYLTNLPTILETENKRYEERITRINELTLEQDNFYKVFLSKHQYFYMPYNNIFYEYDGKTYKIIKEDDIHHHLLSTITDEGKLMAWKHKTKQNIIKQIKDRSLFKSVPETYTIQNVLGFLNTIFETKTETKYFLTVIGDCILKKNVETELGSGLMFFVNTSTKKLVSFIDSIAYITTGNSIMSNFISKYHESHNLSTYRLIKTNENFNSIATDLIKDVLNKIGIDLLCVATHYSERYNNSDQFLINLPKEDPIKEYCMFFLLNTTNKIIDKFISQCIEPTLTTSENTYNLSWKNMHYIWKLYLSSINVPNMIYSNNLKVLLKTRLTFTENISNCLVSSSDIIFTNVTSKYLPSVSSFLSFWEKHITIISNENGLDPNIFDDEYEVDEISSIYKLTNKSANITDKEIIKMIWHYFYPNVEVIDNKYITNIHCNLWSKNDDISDMLSNYKQQKKNEIIDESTLISFDDLYQNYKSYIQAKIIVNKSFHPIVSKHFFEKFISHYLTKYIKFDKFVSSEWLSN